MSKITGADMQPTTRFADRAADYAAARPSYPDAAIDAILDGLARSCDVSPSQLVIADVGAGTGISSRLLAARGVRVIAVEPNDAMRQAGEAEANPRVEWRKGTAESTGLKDNSVHAVVCAQAFHWFRPDESLREFARILAPRGRVALMWNNRDERDSFTLAYAEAINRAATAGGYVEPEMRVAQPLEESRLFRRYRLVETAYEQRLSEPLLIKRALSASYVPKFGPAHERLLADLHAIFERFAQAGAVTLKYVTSVHLADKPA